MTSIETTVQRPCASCGEEIRVSTKKCPACGNAPQREVILATIVSALFGAFLYLTLPTVGLLFIPVIILIALGFLVLDHSPTKSNSLI